MSSSPFEDSFFYDSSGSRTMIFMMTTTMTTPRTTRTVNMTAVRHDDAGSQYLHLIQMPIRPTVGDYDEPDLQQLITRLWARRVDNTNGAHTTALAMPTLQE
jgi:hypothetical protein